MCLKAGGIPLDWLRSRLCACLWLECISLFNFIQKVWLALQDILEYKTKLDKCRCLDDSLQKSTPDLNQDANVDVPAGNFCQGFISFTEGELTLICLIWIGTE